MRSSRPTRLSDAREDGLEGRQRRPGRRGRNRAAGSDRAPETDRDCRAHWVEIHKKFALPFVCFIFVLLGLPLGMTTKKGGRTSGFTISMAIILIYYILITAGEKMAMDGQVTPFLGMWGPNISSWPSGLTSS